MQELRFAVNLDDASKCSVASECAAEMGLLCAVSNTGILKSVPMLFGTFHPLLGLSRDLRNAMTLQVHL